MGSGFRTFASGEVLTSSNVQNYLMDQAVMVFAGTAARASALPSPEVGMTAYSTATGLQVYNGTAWVDVSTGYGVASGANSTATITVSGTSYTLLTFTSSGTLTVTKAGLFDVVVCGGGGSGGFRTSATLACGGGGGGGVVESTIYLTANQTVTVGAKGAAVTVNAQVGNRGSNSAIGSFVIGGGGGGGESNDVASQKDGFGSGGGAVSGTGFSTAGFTGGVALAAPWGKDGGAGATGTTGAGGGGGYGSAGQSRTAGTATGGDGGTGYATTTFTGGTLVTHIGCGGGGTGNGTTGGTAGNSSGGNGGQSGTSAGSNATSTFYGSGGGGGGATTSGAGSDGIVLVRFKV